MSNLILNFIRGLFGGEGSPGAALFETILMFITLPVTALSFLLLYKNIKKLKASEAAADDSEHSSMDSANIELFRAVKGQIRGQRIKLTLIGFILAGAFFCVLAVFIDKLMGYLNAIGVISYDPNGLFIKMITLTLPAPLMIAIIIYAVWTFRNNVGKPEKQNKQYVRYSIYAIFVCSLVLLAGILLLSRTLL